METTSYDQVASLADQLSVPDKIRLMERLIDNLKGDLIGQQAQQPLSSLYGLWADLNVDVSTEDIDEARREMWGNFPREDIA